MTDPLVDRCEREVVELHEFFEGWLSGRLPDDDATFDRARRALAPEFEITVPSGDTVDREGILADVAGQHGGNGEDFEIRIRNLRTRFAFEDACLVTYEEHQRSGADGGWYGWVSTALFRAAPEAPNGVEWIHLQETGLPDEEG